MLNDKVSRKISNLATDLAVAVSLKDPEAWKELSELCASITEDLASQTEFILSDLVNRAEAIFNQLSNKKIVNHDTAISHLTQLINFLCSAAENESYDQAEARELVASTDLYLNDLADAQQVPEESTIPEIDEEFIQEIESRIDSLEGLLFNMMQTSTSSTDNCKSVFREFHTLKGEAGILGLSNLSSFWHSVEDVIQDARSGDIKFNRKALDLLLQMVKLGRDLLLSNKLDNAQEKEAQETLRQLNIAVGNTPVEYQSQEIRSSAQPNNEEEFEDTADFFAAALKSKDTENFSEEATQQTNETSQEEELGKQTQDNNTEPEKPDNQISLEESFATEEKEVDHDDFFTMQPEDGYAEYSEETEKNELNHIAREIQQIEPREYEIDNKTTEDEAEDIATDLREQKEKTQIQTERDDENLPGIAEKTAGAKTTSDSFQIESSEKPVSEPAAVKQPATEISPKNEPIQSTENQRSATRPTEEKTDNIQNNAEQKKYGAVEETGSGNTSPTEKPVDSYSLRNVSIDVKKLDELLDIVSELSLIGSHIANNSEVLNITSATSDLQELQRFCRTLNDMASSFRMTQIAPLFKRIQRAAIDTARAMNKQVDLIIEGKETKVDRIIIERLSAALIHLIRNSVGHGIESADRRREINKSPVGKIRLSARQTGADIVIELGDDGSGLNIAKIREKAINNGLITPETNLKDADIARLIFSSGFSTTDEVNGISGRGVGMSIVQETIDSLRGRIEVDNHIGKGVTFQLRFPVTLAAVEALLVTLGNSILAIPIQSVRETFKLSQEDISTIEGRGQIVNVRGIMVPVISMADFLELPSNSHDNKGGVLVIIDEGEKLAAILVDKVMDTRQVVIRPLEGKLRDIPEITGAALLNNRQISLVLDTRRIIEKTFISSGRAYSDAGAVQVASERKVETVSIGSNAVGIIDFCIRYRTNDGKIKSNTFAINAFKTREFVPAGNLTIVPDMPTGFAGMILLRDDTIPVMALDNLLGMPKAESDSDEFYNIIIICEFSGVTVGFLVSEVNSVSYISWDDINPPPKGGPLFTLKHVIGTILLEVINSKAPAESSNTANNEDVAFLLDFEQIVQQVINLYDNIDNSLGEIKLKKDVTTILLAEDSNLIRRETSNALENAGIQVLQAANGLEAQRIIEQLLTKAKEEGKSIFNYLDLILSDIEMPQMDGYSLTMFCKNHPELRLLPVLLHSSLTNDTIVKRAKEVHADGFISKCAPEELATHLSKYL